MDDSGGGEAGPGYSRPSGSSVLPAIAALLSLTLLAGVFSFVKGKWRERERPSAAARRRVLERLAGELERDRRLPGGPEAEDTLGVSRVEAGGERIRPVWWGSKGDDGAWPFVAVIVDAKGRRTGTFEGSYLKLPGRGPEEGMLTYDRRPP